MTEFLDLVMKKKPDELTTKDFSYLSLPQSEINRIIHPGFFIIFFLP